MAICAGCSSACNCAADGITITGAGTVGDPFVAVGGGGGCTQKNIYTVATVGPAGLGLDLSTQEPFRSCADFIGDGINDQVAINAACTAAVGALVLDIYPEVYLNSGVFATSASIDAQGVTIKGSTRTIVTNNAAASGFPILIDPTVLRDLSVGPLLASNAECTIQVNAAQNIRFDSVQITNAGLGPGTAILEINNTSGNVRIQECSFGGTGNMPATFFTAGYAGRVEIERNDFAICRLDLTMMTFGSRIIGNSFRVGQGPIVGNQGMINLNHDGTNVVISNWIIADNNISQSFGHGIVINGGANPLGFYAWGLVHDNLVYGYGGSGVNAFDGIFLVGNVDELSIQGNKCTSPSAGGRHGINISAATCNDNLVTNNDLFNSGASASFNDAGTATITTAGNRL